MSRSIQEKSAGAIFSNPQSFSTTLNCAPAAISTNKESTQCVVGGRNLLKVFNIEEKRFTERVNLVVGPQNLSYSITDVQWHPLEENLIASAAGNGVIIVWDLNKVNESKKDHIYRHHYRYVNKLCFHPTDSSLLISCCQDGNMNCFDIRKKDVAATFSGRGDSIRDVQFHPLEKHIFCAACESGNVQLWDTRKPDQYYNHYTAHSGPAFTLHWHPEDKYWLGTGGRDHTIKIWETVVKSSSPTHVVQTSAPVHRIKWRPGYKYHIASCSFLWDNNVNIWDIRRPYIPFAAFQEHKEAATGIVWQKDAATMLSCSKDKRVCHHVMANAERPADKAPQVALSLSPQGYIAHAYSTLHQKTKSLPKFTGSNSYPNTPVKKPHSISQEFKADSSILRLLNLQSIMDESYITRLAKNYKFYGMAFSAICDHNSKVSELEKFPEKAETWNILKQLYSSDESTLPHTNHSNGHGIITPRSNHENYARTLETPESFSESNTGVGARSSSSDEEVSGMETPSSLLRLPIFNDQTLVGPELDAVFDDDYNANFFPTELQGDEEQLDRLPNEAFQLRQHLTEKTTFIDERPVKESSDDHNVVEKLYHENSAIPFSNLSEWDFESTVKQMLYHYAEQGDLQMCVTVILALREHIKRDLIDLSVQEEWFYGYLELLYRLHLFNIATEIINHAPIPVQSLNQNSTNVHMQCGGCDKAILPSNCGWYCKNCKKFAQVCTICHVPVKGLYTWCQGCGHGGHLFHLKEWFDRKTLCPTGCGHKCQYS